MWLLWLSALSIRLINLTTFPIWYDEAFTGLMASRPLGDLVAATAGDVHPPLFYLIIWAVTHLTGWHGAFMLRLPSALFGALAAVEMAGLVRSLGQEPGRALIAGAAVALSPAQLWYSQDARSYALLTWLILAAARAVADKRWRRLAPAAALAMYTHNLAAPYLLALAPLAWARGGRRGLGSLALAALAYGPWATVLAGQLQAVGGGFWVPRPDIGAFAEFLYSSTIGARAWPWLGPSMAALTGAVTLTSLIILKPAKQRLIMLYALAFIPPALLLAVSWLWRPVWLDRALIPAGACLVALWALAGAQLARPNRRALLLAVAPVLAALWAGVYFFRSDYDINWRAYAALIDEHWQPGDVIYHANLVSYITLDYYLPGRSVVWPHAGDLQQNLSESTKAAMQITSAPLDQLDYRRAWFIVVDMPLVSSQEEQATREILARYPTLESWPVLQEPMASVDIVLLDMGER